MLEGRANVVAPAAAESCRNLLRFNMIAPREVTDRIDEQRTDHCGCLPVYGEQQTLPEGRNSINSVRVRSGSNRFSCHLPPRPTFGCSRLEGFHPVASSAV